MFQYPKKDIGHSLPSSQVQQRGVQATQDIVKKILDGVPMADGHPVLVVDCMPNRLLALYVKDCESIESNMS